RSSTPPSKHLDHGPVKLDGFAEAAYTVLSEQTRPMATQDLADEIFKRKLVRFHTHDAAMTLQAALVTDNQRRKQRGHRKLFIAHAGSRWGLTEWGLSDELLTKEQRILSLSEECRQEAIGLMGAALLDVAPEALEHVVLTLLEGLGYTDLKVSKRSSDGDVFFSAALRQGLSDVRVCIQVVADRSRELESEVITDLRGTLHHYAAAEGVIVHLGEISKQAIEESREEKLAPVTLIDRTTFVTQLVDQGIGVTRFHTPILLIDTAFLEQLQKA
ncbi:MAG: restriction endonuclease, partial [Myxococcota bacterium]